MPDKPTSDRQPAAPKRRSVAIALRADATRALPVVTAAGHGEFAETLLAIAFANGVPVREDADLAEILQAMEIDSNIPVAAFAAVAEILAYVYRANRDQAER